MKLIDRLFHLNQPSTPPENPSFRVQEQKPPQMIASDDQLFIYDNDGQLAAEYTRLAAGSWSCRFPSYDDPGCGNILPPNSPENLHISFLYFSARKPQT